MKTLSYSLLKQLLTNQNHCWYALVVYMGQEGDIKQRLMKELNIKSEDIIIPENLVEDEDLNEETKNLYKYYLGYMFVKTELTLDIYHTIVETVNVFRFLGTLISAGQHSIYIPSKVKQFEIDNVKKLLSGKKSGRSSKFKVHDSVCIKKGDLSDIQGKIIEVGKAHVKVLPNNDFFTKIIIVPIDNICHVN